MLGSCIATAAVYTLIARVAFVCPHGAVAVHSVGPVLQGQALESSLLFPARELEEQPVDTAAPRAKAVEEVHTSKPVSRILMGHSLGAVCAAAEAIKHPEVGLLVDESTFHLPPACFSDLHCPKE